MDYRVKCIVSYDGANYSGWQIQNNQPSVQEAIEKSLTKIHNNAPIKIYGASRTDAGVHAKGQVFHFDSPIDMLPDRWRLAINTYIENDIFIKSVEIVDSEFHSRFHVEKKEYNYLLSTNQFDPLRRNAVEFERRKLNIELMQSEIKKLVGTHNFKSFTSHSEYTSYERTIFVAEIIDNDGELTFRFVGSGFMRYMIRIMVGTLVEIGYGRKENILEIMSKQDRQFAGKNASSHGLYLEKIWYK